MIFGQVEYESDKEVTFQSHSNPSWDWYVTVTVTVTKPKIQNVIATVKNYNMDDIREINIGKKNTMKRLSQVSGKRDKNVVKVTYESDCELAFPCDYDTVH